eukprot:COSAG05_NODE_23667_length_256_cov_0.828025_1_plen_85_part_11
MRETAVCVLAAGKTESFQYAAIILDVCFDFAEAAAEDAEEGADDSTCDALLALLREVAQLLRATDEEEDREMFVGEDGVELTIAA